MKFTFNWLKEFVTVRPSAEKLAASLTMAGLEVESLTRLSDPQSGEDWLFEIAVTPNRGDCLGLVGLAREVSALTGGRLKSPPIRAHTRETSVAKRVNIKIHDARYCARYSARIVDDVVVASSSPWMRFRLEVCGIRSINNIVDITNYVMLETGQPLHAFDLDRLPARRILVRQAGADRKFTTLDEVERSLEAEDLLICDGDTPVALAGVMGGVNSEVHAGTRSVLLESANFESISIRRTAKRLGLHSEASHRFERGVDPQGTLRALDRAVYLLCELAGARAVGGALDRYPRPAKATTIIVREERIEKLLGHAIERKTAGRLVNSLGLKSQKTSKKGVLKLLAPSSRPDLTREADVIEELARLYGYQKIPTTLPLLRPAGGTVDMRLRRERRIRSFLAGEGLTEVINLPFTSQALNRRFDGLWGAEFSAVTVLNPLIQESGEMQSSLVTGLLENLRVNLAQKAPGFCAFQLGKVFAKDARGEPVERQNLAGLLYGFRERKGLRSGDEMPLTFLDCKGVVEGILEAVGVAGRAHWIENANTALHPGKSAAVCLEGARLGYLGEIHPDLRDELNLPPVLLFELDFEGVVEYAPRKITARSLPRFPSVERDLAVVVDEAFPSQRIIRWIKDLSHSLIEDVEVFDQYRGSSVPVGKKSLAYKISYRAEDKTLTDSEVNALHQNLVDQIGKNFGAQLRS